ncbi:DUF397 domain-containing protein [Streptomyces sp. A5-4]|uniref:DUF397 domain-containing protein n=1 Tax=Streptomyces sp. A5-4 TaxID=3384771 RepID=UPI003DA9A1A4
MIRETAAESPSELEWFKSSYSNSSESDSCVEVATTAHAILVRGSKPPPGRRPDRLGPVPPVRGQNLTGLDHGVRFLAPIGARTDPYGTLFRLLG